MTAGIRIQMRRDTMVNWTATNPVLAAGEKGLETDTGRTKIGDGATAWTALRYRFDGAVASSTKTADYVLGLVDVGSTVEFNSASDLAVKLPSEATAIPVGSVFDISRLGAGKVSILPEFQNLVSNPSLETDTAGWTPRGTSATLARVADCIVKKGNWGGRVTGGATSTLGYFFSIPLAGSGLVVGDKVSARIDLSTSVASGAFLQLRFQTSGGVAIRDDSGNTVGASGTTGTSKIEGSVIPAGTDIITVMGFCSGVLGTTLDFDGLMVVKGPKAPTAYADPSLTTGMSWIGTAHASTSQGPLTVRGGFTTVPRYGRMRLRKRAADDWVLETQPNDEVMFDTDAVLSDRDNGQAGMYAHPIPATVANAALASNQLYLGRVAPSRAITATTVAFRVTTASATNDPVEVGIYDASGTRVATSGSVTGKLNSTGTKTVTFTGVVLQPGTVYYVYLTATSSTAVLAFASFPGDLFGTAMPQAEMMSKAGVAPGATATPLTGAAVADAVPLMAVR